MVDGFDARDLLEWEAFERVHGPVLVGDRVDLMLAQVCAILAGGNVADFLPPWAKHKQTAEEMISLFRSMTR